MNTHGNEWARVDIQQDKIRLCGFKQVMVEMRESCKPSLFWRNSREEGLLRSSATLNEKIAEGLLEHGLNIQESSK